MKRFWIVCFGFGLFLGIRPGLAQQHKSPLIILDPGHGGIDSGAIGVNGIMEKDVVLAVGEEVLRLNKELYGNQLEIYLTRYSDTLISLGDRTKLAKALGPSVFVSIHCNQAIRKKAQGVEVYIQHPHIKMDPKLLIESEDLARTILLEFDNALGFKIRGRKYANFQVLRETQFTCPAVLLELGFLSNSEEAMHSMKKSSISGYAMAILQTLIEVVGKS
ncbi:N-acetylmuramoyl-L-alanine amidase [Arenibacter sp. 6A1]|uniref:N-acetylmuramoyl-L-alanine amidase family protein n=1 Tax=Arenibacter sp. 6A1 TaxID=2720391 RepID=UPI00144862C9|nr:N-acetylmuramoyl-L-alanine amidase [Arenibacter sp. 6A1]NKI27449.1 N-acetylmuramoyl-L-alanine amidase [Arenibacter sp. 6A1]